MLEISNTIKSVLQWVLYISAIAILLCTLVLFVEAIFIGFTFKFAPFVLFSTSIFYIGKNENDINK